MRSILSLLPIFALILAACNGGSSAADADWTPDVSDPGGDMVQADPGVDEGDTDFGEDVATESDVGADVPMPVDAFEVDPGPPDPSMTHWVRDRTTCVPDGPWKVDTVTQFRTIEVLPDLDIRAVVGGVDGLVWAGLASGLARRDSGADAFTAVADLPGTGAVSDLAVANAGVRIARGIWVGLLDSDGVALSGFDAAAAVDRVADCDGDGYVVSGGRLMRIGDGELEALVYEAPGNVHDVACVDAVPLAATDQGLFRLGDDGWNAIWNPGNAVIVAAGGGGRIAASTGDNVTVFEQDGTTVAVFVPEPGGLPTGDVTSLALSADGNLLSMGHAIGATRIDLTDGHIDHFVSLRWLPDDAVASVYEALDGVLWVATPAGVSALRRVDTTLADKAVRMRAQMDWFWRLGGFVSPWARFPDPWSPEEPLANWDDDNDGQWTQEAVGALCYAYATTGNDAFYEAAHKAMTNMVLLVDVPAADFEAAGLGRGFVTRSVVRDDEGLMFDSKATQSNWHLTTFSDGHDYYWKDDTSADEVTGHLFGFSLYYDLCAQDDDERAWVGESLGALAGYILDHGFTLPDLGGEQTSHGNWSSSRIPISLDGLDACMDAGHELVACIESFAGGAFLGSIEVLALMLSAYHVTGDVRFWIAYDALVRVNRYDLAATFHDEVVTWAYPATANYCDHELADLAFLTLIRYEPDPVRRLHWIDQVLAAWEYEIGERNPLKTLVMAAVQDDVPGLAAGVSTLVDYPEDLREWLVDNSHRVDYRRNVADRFQTPQFRQVPPYDEITIKRWDHNPYRVSDGGSGDTRMSPTFWLLPYWGLRYHNAICNPEVGY